MTKTLITAGALALGLLTTTLAPSAKADTWDKRTVITVTGAATKIQGTVLAPGKYILKLLDSQFDRRILQIFNTDGTKLETTILAGTAYRLEPTGGTQFTFAEVPADEPLPITRWFYPGDSYGLQFSAQ